MLSAGKLNDRVTILEPTTEQGKFGEQVTTWKVGKTVWAKVVFQRGVHALTAGESWLTGSIAVTMRDNKVIHDRCRLRWDGKTYLIESFNRSGRDGSIAIVATKVDEGNQPAGNEAT
jgi:SPP1 family predicted phage head-tail adaptor